MNASPDEHANSINISGDAKVNVERDIVAGDKNVLGSEYNVNIKPGATVGQLVAGSGNTQIYIERLILDARRTVTTSRFSIAQPTREFIGRAREIEKLHAQLSKGRNAIGGVVGMAGLGKTELARFVAHRMRQTYFEGCEVDLKGASESPARPVEAMGYIIRALTGFSEKLPDNEDEIKTMYRALLDGKHALILLDDAKGAWQVKEIVRAPGCAFLITSRTFFTLNGMTPMRLDVLKPEEAKQLLLQLCPRIGDASGELAELCGRLPLALEIAGSFLAERDNKDVIEYAGGLRAHRLEMLKQEDDRDFDVEAAFEETYSQLPGDLQRMWRKLGVFPSPFPSLAAGYVWVGERVLASEQSMPEITDTLEELRRLSLVDLQSGYYRVHELLREFAVNRWTNEEREQAQKAHATFYSRILWLAGELYDKGGDNMTKALELFDLDLGHIRAGQKWAAEHVDVDDEAALLCSMYADSARALMRIRLAADEQITWLEAAIRAARLFHQRKAEGVHLGNVGSAYLELGEAKKAIMYYEQAIQIANEVGTDESAGIWAGNLGNVYQTLGKYDKAIEYHEQALTIHRYAGNDRLVGKVLTNLGSDHLERGDTRRALEYFTQALAIATNLGDRLGEYTALANFGAAYADLGDARQALEYFTQALAIATSLGDRAAIGKLLDNLGTGYNDLGDARKAIEYHEQAVRIAREIGNRRIEETALGNLGSAHSGLGDERKAIKYYQQALTISREIGDRKGEGADLGNLGGAYRKIGDVRRAIQYYEQALEVARQIGDRSGERNRLDGLGNAYDDLGDARRAIEYHELALAISREIGDRSGEGTNLGNLGSSFWELGEAQVALGFYNQALSIARELGERRGEGGWLGALGAAYYSLGDVRQAIEMFTQALAVAKEIGDRYSEGNWLGNLGGVHRDLRETRRAIEYFEEAHMISREIGDRRNESRHLANLGSAYRDLGDITKAIELYGLALTITKETNDRRLEGVLLYNLADTYLSLGERGKARKYGHEALEIMVSVRDPRSTMVEGWLSNLVRTR